MVETRKTVLVVEDHDINRRMICELLNEAYDTIEASNGLDAINKLELNQTVGVIILDLIMPVMNGFEFLEKIKKTKYKSIPIIVSSGNSNLESERKALLAGAIDFVGKPIDKVILLRRVKNAMARSQVLIAQNMEFIASHDPLTKLQNRNKICSLKHENYLMSVVI